MLRDTVITYSSVRNQLHFSVFFKNKIVFLKTYTAAAALPIFGY
jgi:hypothetical protein